MGVGKKTGFLGLRLISTRLVRWVVCFSLMFTLFGCEAFVRKFTRKPKKENLPQEEMVLAPEEYKAPQLSKEEQYRQYFLFWRAWSDELITSLSKGANHKKQIDCSEEAIKNLVDIRVLLTDEKQKKIDPYINKFALLKDAITQDIYGNSIDANRQAAEHIKSNFLKDFSYNKIKGYLR